MSFDKKEHGEKEEQIWLSSMTKVPTPNEKSKKQRDKTKGHQNFNYTTIADRLRTFQSVLRDKSVQILSNNITVIAYINHKSGPSTVLSQLVMSIWVDAIDNRLSIQCAHIAVRENRAADHWSKTTDKHNWMFLPRLFAFIDRLWGPHTVDRFANCVKAQLPRFNSRFEPLLEGIDALSQINWGQEHSFLNAPFCLLSKVLDVVETQRATATGIAPAQMWFRRLLKMSIAPPINLPQSANVFLENGNSTGATKEREVENICLEDMWRSRLRYSIPQVWIDNSYQANPGNSCNHASFFPARGTKITGLQVRGTLQCRDLAQHADKIVTKRLT